MGPRPRFDTLTITITILETGQKKEMTIETRSLGEWHMHPHVKRVKEPQLCDTYWEVSHQYGFPITGGGVTRIWARKLLHRLAALPACPVPPDVERKMTAFTILPTPEFREWTQMVKDELEAWRRIQSRRRGYTYI